MITGDHLLIAKETARRLDMGTNIHASAGLPMLDADTKQKPADLSTKYGDLILNADGFAQVFPEHKYLIVECLREMGYKTGAFVCAIYMYICYVYEYLSYLNHVVFLSNLLLVLYYYKKYIFADVFLNF